ncbi:lipopolysaccharide assembly protein LapB [Desulforhopalus sp. IMCC35007]|uniref:tetratricopeptide repeat protein n=1 Tax=Desulforhopalus sp. IMCC35007 TaxID=2569543 RepID=UPI0010AE5DF3|nr:tetratricopeptide repeat protein [Desulforhopalus sp. IMCC35007]TKB07583.1 tetratricopeptide repeat protein [Desulforhopalus sp. IMCC35007]
MTRHFIIANILISFLSSTVVMADDTASSFKNYLEQANDYIKSYRHYEASDALKEATKLGGAEHPSLHMRLGILYYGLGLIPEAIEQGERAVHLAPASKWYKFDLAKFYFVDKQFDKAEQQFTTLLRIDPGFTFAYYYLAELYFKNQKYDMAWLSMQRAYQLGYKGRHLEDKIAPLSSQPKENLDPPAESPKLFRFIKLASAEQAQKINDEIWNGKLFENVELELKKEQSPSAEFGILTLDELRASVADSLRDKKPYSRPLIIQTGPDYRILQRILPFDPKTWQETLMEAPPVQRTNATTSKTEQPDPRQQNVTATAKQPNADIQISNKLAAFYALEAWKDAWETQDANSYLGAYSKNFTPEDGLSLSVWKDKRTRSIYRPSSIKIDIENPVVETLEENQLLITFKQSYTSNSYHDIVMKALTMEKEENGWKIIREREIKKFTD